MRRNPGGWPLSPPPPGPGGGGPPPPAPARAPARGPRRGRAAPPLDRDVAELVRDRLKDVANGAAHGDHDHDGGDGDEADDKGVLDQSLTLLLANPAH